jgi:hypothetical protein
MTVIKAKHLLGKLASNYKKEKETFSKKEIINKINEVKYLSAKKKVPRLTLRKEIIHLEKKLEGIFELETTLLKQKKKESYKVHSLKTQITRLKKQLEASGGKNLHKKVEQLSHVLGEVLAKSDILKDVKLSQKIIKEIKQPIIKKKLLDEAKITKLKILKERIQMLKHELEVNKALGKKSPEAMNMIEEKIHLLEENLEKYSQKNNISVIDENIVENKEPHPDISEITKEAETEVRHKLIFGPAEVATEEEIESELPLPPPPRIIK